MVNYLQNNCDFDDFSICHSRVRGNPVLNILNLDSHFHGNDNRSLTSFFHNEAWHRQVDGSYLKLYFHTKKIFTTDYKLSAPFLAHLMAQIEENVLSFQLFFDPVSIR